MSLIYNIGLPVFIGGILLLTLSTYKLILIYKSNTPSSIGLFGIWLLGLLTFLTGVLKQIINIKEAFEVIAESGDISSSIVADSIGDSYNTSISGLFVLIISLICWGIIRTIRDSRTNRLRADLD